MNKDGKLKILQKEEVKENLGRSPDFSDSIMMRMFFELKSPSVSNTARVFIPKGLKR